MRLGLMTGGGDAPGLNGIIESVTKTLVGQGHTVVGIQDGFEGVYKKAYFELTVAKVHGISSQAGTLLGTSNRSRIAGHEEEFVTGIQEMKLDGLIVAGGDGTFTQLSQIKHKIPLIGIPKTIDNDITGTDFSFGYDTACSVVADAVHNLKATASSHQRTIFVEVMGRNAGWIALGGGLAAYGDAILIPEKPFLFNELEVFLKTRRDKGQRGLLVVCSEGAFERGESPTVAFHDSIAPVSERLGGVAEKLARRLELAGLPSRHVVLGHLQRSAPPTASDKMLTLSLGVFAARLASEKRWNHAVVYRKGEVFAAPLEDLMKGVRVIESGHRWLQLAQDLDIFIDGPPREWEGTRC